MKMDTKNEEIAKKIIQAGEIIKISNVDAPLKGIAFKEVLKYLLNSSAQISPIKIDEKNPGIIEKIQQEIPDSLVNYIKKAEAKSHSDKILMMAYFMMTVENKIIFNNSEIKEKYLEIREAPSKNLTVEFNGLFKKGFIMLAPDKKSYIITRSGIEYIQDKIENGRKK